MSNNDKAFRRFLMYDLVYTMNVMGVRLVSDKIDLDDLVDYMVMANENECYTSREYITDTMNNYPGEYFEKV